MPATSPISPSAVRVARDLRVGIGRLRRLLKEVADRGDLTPSQASVLSRLDQGGPASTSDLAAAERVRPQSMASTLAALEERALVGRRPDPDDGRRHLISLSSTGRQYIEGHHQEREEWLARVLQERFSEDERRAIIEALGLLDRIVGP